MCDSERQAAASSIEGESHLRVFEVDFRTDPRWIPFVSEHPNGSIYHHPLWLRALEKEYEQNFVSLACLDANGQFRAILPLAYTRGMPFGLGGSQAARRLSSLPRTPVCGSLATDPLAEATVVRAAVERIRQAPGSCLQLKVRESGLHELVDGLIHTPWRFTYILKLPDRPENLRFGNSRNHTRIMWSVHKALKLGVQVRPADTVADLKAWYKIYLETMRRNVVPPRSYRFFLSLWESMRPLGLLQLMLAELDGRKGKRLLAGSLFLRFGQTVHYAFNGARKESFSLRPNDLIQWQAIQNSCLDGFRWFDFGEVPDGNTQLAEFKSKWGARPLPLHRYYYPKASAASSAASMPDGYSTRLAMEVWRRLPLAATAWLGDAIYAYM
jgi:hypothetical protein